MLFNLLYFCKYKKLFIRAFMWSIMFLVFRILFFLEFHVLLLQRFFRNLWSILNLFCFVLFLVVVVYFWRHSNHLYLWLLLRDKYTKKQQDSLASTICLVLTKYLSWKNYTYNIHRKRYDSHLVTFLWVLLEAWMRLKPPGYQRKIHEGA